MASMTEKERMLAGERYKDSDPELVSERRRCQALVDSFNATTSAEEAGRHAILTELLGAIGVGLWIMPRFQCDYGYLISMGANSFLNYDAILMDCAPITIGDDVSIGPRVQLLTALHPMTDHQARRERWETAKPITIGDNAVVGAGAVVTRDVPPKVFAAGNPCRVLREL